MSNPYDPPKPNEGEQPSPYGAPIPSGGGGGYGNPYGQSPYGGNELPKKTDAVSITGFVLSLTCCLSIVGAILGFIGLSRTKGGQRKGRWAAISASIIGIVGTLAFAGGIVFVVYIANNAITPDDAEVGQCANVTDNDDSISLQKKDCDSSHDAEIVAVGVYGDLNPELVPDDINDLSDSGISYANCASLMDPADVQTLGDTYDWTLAAENADDPSDSDSVVCFIERSDGDKLDAPVL